MGLLTQPGEMIIFYFLLQTRPSGGIKAYLHIDTTSCLCGLTCTFSVFAVPVVIFSLIMLFMDIFIGNLSSRTTEKELQLLFEPFGKVRDVIIAVDGGNQRSRGFGFVTMAARITGEQAVAELNTTLVHQQPIEVHEAIVSERWEDVYKNQIERYDCR